MIAVALLLTVALVTVAYAIGHAVGRESAVEQMSKQWMDLHGPMERSDDWLGEGNTRSRWRVK